MKWNVKDVEMYSNAREYVDTVLVPLVPIAFDDHMQQMTLFGDFITILSMEMEKMFKGRIFLTPTFYYVKDDHQKVASLLVWEKELKRAEFKHIFFLSSDASWEENAKNLMGSFLFIPNHAIEHLDREQVHQMIKQQSQILIDNFANKWKNGI